MSKFSLTKLKKGASRSTPAQKLLTLLFLVAVIGIVVYLWPEGSSKNTNEVEDYSDTASKAKVGGFNVRGNDNNYSVIEDPTTPQGKMALIADRERVLKDQRSGKSSIAAFAQEKQLAVNEKNDAGDKDDVRANLKEALAKLKKSPQKRDTSWINNNKKPEPKVNTVTISEKPMTEEERINKILENIPAFQLQEEIEKYTKQTQGKLSALASSKARVEAGASGGFKLIDIPEIEVASSTVTEDSSQPAVNSQNANNTEEVEFNTFLPQGAKLSAYSGRPIDSRFNTNFILTIDYGALAGATLSCNYQRNSDYLIPSCSDMTFERETVSIVAAVLNPDTMGAIINQSRDSETLLKTLALMVTGTAAVYGENKFAQGTTVSSSDTTVVQEQNLSDSDLIAGSATTVIGTLSAEAMQYFMEDDVINIKQNESMIITLLQPIKAPWITKKPLVDGVDYL